MNFDTMPRLASLLESVFDQRGFRAACEAVARRKPESVLSGLTQPAKAIVIAGLAHEMRRTLVVLTTDNEAADRLQKTASTALHWLEGDAGFLVAVLPAWDCLAYEGRSPHADISERRAVTLWNLARNKVRVLFVPLPAALARYREKLFYGSLALELKVGDELDLNDLVEHLASVGYEPAEPVENVGQVSVRGGIVDVFPPEAQWAYRLEFFGDRIESLREFDPITQRSRRPSPSALLLPLFERKRSPKLFEDIVKALVGRAERRRGGSPDARHQALRIDSGNTPQREPEWAPSFSGPFPGWEFYAPLVEPLSNNLLALADQPLLIWDEITERKRQLNRTLESWTAAYEEVRDAVPSPPRPEDILLTEAEFWKAIDGIPQLALNELSVESTSQPPDSGYVLHSQPAPKFHGGVKAFVEDLRARLGKCERVILALSKGGKAERLREILSEYEIPFASEIGDGGSNAAADSRGPAVSTFPVTLAPGEIEEGVVFSEAGLALLSDGELFGKFDWGGRGRRPRPGISTFISSLSDLKVGDYVVHVDHGIGIYQGLRQLEVEGSLKDFMALTYQDDARLYVPLERLDLVEKYRSSADGVKPPLDRLGGTTWQRTKTRVKRALRDMAEELLRLYAERKMRGGTATSPDTPWQKEFEDAFEFDETPDQLAALEEIKQDLESPEPMDRLLCGDVGYGKTELAMRAAFKVAQDSKQVALLAPTTVLAFQHHETFRQRLSAFPVRIEMLSRFRSAAEQKKVLADVETGKVDILIGTHRLLSKDVRFRDLGLLIVDEEQRFGVAAKEKLKRLSVGVDVLTLSATPIPRTLHMSLGGVRDLSVIETPPQGRLAIQTTVSPFNQGLIQAAILQEMERQGQVYFVHNRVESIFSIAALVQRLVPTARLGVAHGQMGERELEEVMLKFMKGEYDVLVATALIENGLDIPRANTMVVNHAERFGMADLYQLRGRVGRSNRRAYAFFLIAADEALTPTAKRRLAALKEFSDLGAGFRLAALDLELRGAGNLLGREQHGHLDAIGFDLYLKMLDQTVEELKGAPARPEVHTGLNLGLDIKIPDRYIADESQRLRMYKRISGISTPEARTDLEAELSDRYGPIPPSVTNLLSYALLKSAAEGLLVQSIERKAGEVWVRFHEQAPVDPAKLTQFVRSHRGAHVRPEGLLRFPLQKSNGDMFEQIQNVLQELYAGH